MSQYIDLSLKSKSKNDNQEYELSEIIKQHQLIVVLGAPGSGKTSILRKYEEEHKQEAQFVSIKKFLRLNTKIQETIKVILLDGLDEYRSLSNIDKSFVITELGNKLKEYSDKKIVVTCREMDWYGDSDERSLQDELNKEAAVFCIQQLNQKQKSEFSRLLEVQDPEPFIEKYDSFGFLDNPQMFVMTAKEYKNDPRYRAKSKQELYKNFIEHAKEKNQSYIYNGIHDLEPNRILIITGYLACFYMFGDVEFFTDEVIDDISCEDQEFRKKDLLAVLDSSLFGNRVFIHRTIAEYACAYFLVNRLLKQQDVGNVHRIKTFFDHNGKIPTELRGVFAWVCSLSGNKDLLVLDPYYQAVFGDNSLFPAELKQEIIENVRALSRHNPYFINFKLSTKLEGFYHEKLDPILMKALKEAKHDNTHFSLFIINIIVSAQGSLSEDLNNFIKELYWDNEFSTHYKDYLLEAFTLDEHEFLKSILEGIRDKLIDDSQDDLKESLLTMLYPEYIIYDEVADYLVLYHTEEVIGLCWFLLSTPYEYQYKIVDHIYRLSYSPGKKKRLKLPKNTIPFIENYFARTISEYPSLNSAQQVYDIFMHFKRNYYEEFEKIRLRSIRSKIEDNKEKLERLSNELFEIFVEDMLGRNTKVNEWLYSFFFLFDFLTPTNRTEVLLRSMSKNLNSEVNKELFIHAFRSRCKDEDITVFKEKAKEFGLEDDLNKLLHPQKQPWEIESEKIKKEKEKKDKETLQKNEEYFAGKSAAEIQADFKGLLFIAKQLFVNTEYNSEIVYLTKKTFNRLEEALKDLINAPLLHPELLTLDSLAKSAVAANRQIDIIYYAAVQLNERIDTTKLDLNFVKYLYINSILQSASNVIQGTFAEQLEKNNIDFTINILQEYAELLFFYQLSSISDQLTVYVKDEKDLERLKRIINIHPMEYETIQDCILRNFIWEYGFSLSVEDLCKIETLELNKEMKKSITALKIFALSEDKNLSQDIVVSIFWLSSHRIDLFTSLDKDRLLSLIDSMMDQFLTEEDIVQKDGIPSAKDMCVNFLRYDVFNGLSLAEFLQLQEMRENKKDVWTARISNRINELQQNKTDSTYQSLSIEKVKNFLFGDVIVDTKEFFEDVSRKIEELTKEIAANRDNEKDAFYSVVNGKYKPKKEEACRDIVVWRLNDKYGLDWFITRERYESDNRVDINIKYKSDERYEVQIECKKDNNKELYSGIKNQLIDKYLQDKVEYGIYLIFYFGDKMDNDTMIKKLEGKIPDDYKHRIKVIYLDLKR